MGKYSTVDAGNLKNQAQKALNELSQNSLENIKNNLQNDNVLNSGAREVAVKALEKTSNSSNINGSISVLRENLKKLSNAADNIITYQNLEKENINFKNQIERLKPNLYYTKRHVHQYVDELGRTHEDISYEQVLDHSVQNEINNLKMKINNNNTKIKKLETKIDGILN